jgi:protein-disulfide isomerase
MTLRTLLLLACAINSCLLAQEGTHRPVAKVAGDVIYEDDLPPLILSQLHQLRSQEYELEEEALEKVARDKLVEHEARRHSISKEALFRDIDSTVPEPSKEEVTAFYLAQKNQIDLPFDDIRIELRKALKQAQIDDARRQYVDKLWEASEVAIFLQRSRVKVDVDQNRVRGSANAVVTIIEFADFQCPFSQKVQLALKEVMEKYSGRVRVSFRDFPLFQSHGQAMTAAQAARCAAEQGKFWEYHDMLFADPGKLSEEGLVQSARTLHLNASAFEACLASGKFKGQIETDIRAGVNTGVRATPTFFINGIQLSGAHNAHAFETIINGELGH